MRQHLLCLFLLLPLTINAQLGNIYHRNITVMDGLANNTVRHVMQDRRGFLWFATLDGVNRYDGYTLTAVPHGAGEIYNRNVKYLMEDANGNIWMQRARDVYSCYNPQIQHFINIPLITGKNKSFKNIACSGDGSVLLYGSDGNCCMLHLAEGQYLGEAKPFRHLAAIRQVVAAKKGYYLATSNGLLYWQAGQAPRRLTTTDAIAIADSRCALLANGDIIDIATRQVRLRTNISTITAQGVSGQHWLLCKPRGIWRYDMQRNMLTLPRIYLTAR